MDVMDWREREQLHEHISMLTAEIARTRLTDAEREAVLEAIDALEGVEDLSADATVRRINAASRMRGLLERLR